MDLTKLAIAVRPRSAWEAIDLGLKMGRRWWWPMVRIWLLLTAPLIALACLLPPEYSWMASMVYWWGKNLWERPLLQFLSLAIFNQELPLKQSLTGAWGLFNQDLLPSVLWRRLSPRRSFVAPVLQLEGLEGKKRRDRIVILSQKDGGSATTVTMIFVHLEGFLLGGAFFALYSFLPKEVELSWIDVPAFLQSQVYLILNAIFYWCISAAIAPFYVACGFALYLNRRVSLEAWDIEIAFRQLLQRYKTPLGAAAITLLLGLCLVPEKPTWADTSPTLAAPTETIAPAPATEVDVKAEADVLSSDRQAARDTILAVKKRPEFHLKKQLTQLKWRWPWDHTKTPTDPIFPPWLLHLLSSIPTLAEILLWLLAITLFCVVALKYRFWLARFGWLAQSRRGWSQGPERLFGLDIRPETLPADIGASAWELIDSGKARAGVGLLYRASLSQLIIKGLQIPKGFTEGDCLHQVTNPANTLALSLQSQTYFATLTDAWRQLAYGHQPAEGLQALCEQWQAAWAEVTHVQ